MANQQKSHKLKKAGGTWYKPFIVPGIVALVLIGIVLVFVKGEVDRFTFIMPIFAGYILYMILTSADEE